MSRQHHIQQLTSTQHFITPVVIAAVWSCPPAQVARKPTQHAICSTFLENHRHAARSPGRRCGERSTGGSARPTSSGSCQERCHTVRTGSHGDIDRAGIPPPRSPERIEVEIRDDDRCPGRGTTAWSSRRIPHQAVRPARPTRHAAETRGARRVPSYYAVNPTVLHHRRVSLLPRSPWRPGILELPVARWVRQSTAAVGAGQLRHEPSATPGYPGDASWCRSIIRRPGRPRQRSIDTDAATSTRCTHLIRLRAQKPVATPLDDHLTAFAGAYHGWGFHEDGALIRSGPPRPALGGALVTGAPGPRGATRYDVDNVR